MVKNVSNPSDLLKWELFFMDKFSTKEPFGLNIDNPINHHGYKIIQVANLKFGPVSVFCFNKVDFFQGIH